MQQDTTIQVQIAATIALLRAKLGVRGKTLAASLRRAKHLLPRRVYTHAMKLAQAEQMARHPKLRLTLDTPHLAYAVREVQAHLHAIDLADRRWGTFLGVLAGIAANLLMLAVLVFILLWWRELI